MRMMSAMSSKEAAGEARPWGFAATFPGRNRRSPVDAAGAASLSHLQLTLAALRARLAAHARDGR